MSFRSVRNDKVLPPLHADTAVLLVVDLQERLLPAMDNAEAVVAAAGRMIRAAHVLKVPVLATEQYPAGLGRTVAPIRDALGDGRAPFEKMCFTACAPAVSERLKDESRPAVVVVGIEAHVCVQQTVLDLLRTGYQPYVCADAVTSRKPLDRDLAMERMRHAGAIITTTESVIFEILGEAGTEQFKQVLKIVK